MIALTLLCGLLGQTEATGGHPANRIARENLSAGLKVGDVSVTLPTPTFADGLTSQKESEALRTLAGSTRAAEDLTRDSVSAPMVLRTRDRAVEGRGIIRAADLWFVVRARLEDIDPQAIAAAGQGAKTAEAANMKFTASRLGEPSTVDGVTAWSVRLTGRLLDRIQVEAADRVMATRSESSWLIASRAEGETPEMNRWFPIVRKGAVEEPGKAEGYPGGVSYVRIGRLGTVPGALMVEAHFAFFEPKAWFDGAPILRSKIGVVAQDRIRALRRELAAPRDSKDDRKKPGPTAR